MYSRTKRANRAKICLTIGEIRRFFRDKAPDFSNHLAVSRPQSMLNHLNEPRFTKLVSEDASFVALSRRTGAF